MSYDYWRECVSCALSDAGVDATGAQIDAVANDIRIGVEMQHEYSAPAPSPMVTELENAKKRAVAREEELERRLHATEKLAMELGGFRPDSYRMCHVEYRDGQAYVETR